MIRQCTENDRANVLAFANEKPGENLFIIGDIESFGICNETVQTWVEEIEGKLEGIYLKYRNNFVIYSKSQNFDSKEVANLISTHDIKNINCLKKTADLLMPILQDEYTASQCYYCILKSDQKLDSECELCTDAREEDTKELANKLSKIKEFHHDEKSALETVQRYFSEDNRINIIMKVDNEIAGSATTAVQSTTAAMIGTVFTVEKFRNRGIASKVVSTLCRRVLSQNKECVLFYDNPKSGSIYHLIVFETVDEWCLFRKK